MHKHKIKLRIIVNKKEKEPNKQNMGLIPKDINSEYWSLPNSILVLFNSMEH